MSDYISKINICAPESEKQAINLNWNNYCQRRERFINDQISPLQKELEQNKKELEELRKKYESILTVWNKLSFHEEELRRELHRKEDELKNKPEAADIPISKVFRVLTYISIPFFMTGILSFVFWLLLYALGARGGLVFGAFLYGCIAVTPFFVCLLIRLLMAIVYYRNDPSEHKRLKKLKQEIDEAKQKRESTEESTGMHELRSSIWDYEKKVENLENKISDIKRRYIY